MFTPAARSSYRWQDYYALDSAVGRVHGRPPVDRRPRDERPAICGLATIVTARHHADHDHAGDGLEPHPAGTMPALAESAQPA